MKYIALGGMIGYMVCYGLALGPISWFIAVELVSLHYRASMFCATLCVNSFCVVATNFAAVPLFNKIGVMWG
uniref:Major facilitator superfamily (MFS) profile domain-containing protein n=1 Tax=Acrobeloides nanus TaxID=290746 RepID=A0A914BWJ0_9BILA